MTDASIPGTHVSNSNGPLPITSASWTVHCSALVYWYGELPGTVSVLAIPCPHVAGSAFPHAGMARSEASVGGIHTAHPKSELAWRPPPVRDHTCIGIMTGNSADPENTA